MSLAGCSSNASASSCSKPTPASTLRGGRAQPTQFGASCARTRLTLGGRALGSAGADPLPLAATPSEAARPTPDVRDRWSRSPTAACATATSSTARRSCWTRSAACRSCASSCRRSSRSTPRRPTRTRWRARRSTSRPRASSRACSSPTPAWHRAVAVLKAHHFLVLTGPPEMGKTAIARMLGLALLTEGWEVHECTRPEQVEQRFERCAAAAVHRRRRVRLDRVPAGRRRALGGRAGPDPARDRRAALARLDLAARAAARRPAPAAPRARWRALPEPRRGAGRRFRPRRRGADADPLPPCARGAAHRGAARADPGQRRGDRRAPALHARADPALRRLRPTAT